MNMVSKYSWALGCAVAVLFLHAEASGQVLSLKLNGYLPNSYGVCRNITGLEGGTLCQSSSTCPAGQTCRNRFTDVSCTTNQDCVNAIGAGTCVDMVIIPSDPPVTRKRCSPLSNVPLGVVEPSNRIIVEAYLEDWDLDPLIGECAGGSNACNMNDAEPCKSCRESNEPPGTVCQTNTQCTSPDTCQVDQYCINDRDESCEVDQNCPIGPPDACVPRTCDPYPIVSTYQWTVDALTYANDHGLNSVLENAEISCTVANQLDTCQHGNSSSCTCTPPECQNIVGDVGTCSGAGVAYIESFRADYIFSELSGMSPTTTCSLAVPLAPACNATIGPVAPGVQDDGRARYLGTIVLDVPSPARACGTYEVGCLAGNDVTFLRDNIARVIPIPANNLLPLVLAVTADPVCNPPDCNDDNLCTKDECTCRLFGDPCVHTTIVECPEGEVCNPATGLCVPGTSGACCVGEDCTVTAPASCAGDYQGDGTDCDPNPCAASAVALSWESVATHGAVVGEVGLLIAENGTYVEPRSTGVRKIIVTYDAPVTAAGSMADILDACGVDGLPVNVGGIAVATAQGAPEEVIITFTPQLPGSGLAPGTHKPTRYRIELTGVGGAVADTSREFSVVLGDAFIVPTTGLSDARVTAADNGVVRSLAAAGIDPIDPDNVQHVRADVFTDGRITAADNGAVRSLAAEGLNGQGLVVPCP